MKQTHWADPLVKRTFKNQKKRKPFKLYVLPSSFFWNLLNEPFRSTKMTRRLLTEPATLAQKPQGSTAEPPTFVGTAEASVVGQNFFETILKAF